MRKILFLLTILALNLASNAQKIGEWTAHTPGLKVISVDKMHNKVFAATPYDIFYYNIDDNSINHLSKVNGLSDNGISVIKYDSSTDIIFVGYTNTDIDLIDNNGKITNIPDIYNKYILGNKTINDVFFHNNCAYVCCGFGIVVIDIKRKEVKDTYFIGDEGSYMGVNDLTICGDYFYAATERGIYYAEVDNPYLADYSQWTRFSNHLPNYTSNYSHVETLGDRVIANYSDNENDNDLLVEIYNTTTWDYFTEGIVDLVNDLRVCDDVLVVTLRTSWIYVYDVNKNVVFYSGMIPSYSTLYDKKLNCYWCGTPMWSLVKLYPDDRSYERITFNGPSSNLAFDINTTGNDVWVATGGYSSTWAQLYGNQGVSHYNGSNWSSLTPLNLACLDTIRDITCVKPSPVNNNIVYLASYGKGIVVLNNGVVSNVYSGYNSGIGFNLAWLQLGVKYTFITGFDFDSSNNMWLTSRGADKQLTVWKTNGTWQSYNIGIDDTGRLMVDKNDVKWIFMRGGTATVFYNGTAKTVNKGASTGDLPGDLNCFATDNNGTVWIGTTDGVALFYDSKKIFRNNSYACSRILIPRNDGTGQADYLLSGQSVLAIAVDGANNIWFGTNNGVIQTSNDGQTTYHHFTMENSPLFSNTVKDIAIDDDGNVYFSTDQGIVAYKGTATAGQEKNDNVVVYPNPVRPEHNGIVGIKGLVTNSLVKITTTDGTFVTHMYAQGGQAVWDCTDISGNKVAPGIYLIFTSDENGKETYATKVLIMR